MTDYYIVDIIRNCPRILSVTPVPDSIHVWRGLFHAKFLDEYGRIHLRPFTRVFTKLEHAEQELNKVL